MHLGQQTGYLQVGYARLSDDEYRRELGNDMHHKPALDTKIQKLVELLKKDDDADFISAWVKFPFWEGRIDVSLGEL